MDAARQRVSRASTPIRLRLSASARWPRMARTVWAGTTQGLYRSTDGGATWAQITVAAGSPNARVTDVVMDGANVYVVLSEADRGIQLHRHLQVAHRRRSTLRPDHDRPPRRDDLEPRAGGDRGQQHPAARTSISRSPTATRAICSASTRRSTAARTGRRRRRSRRTTSMAAAARRDSMTTRSPWTRRTRTSSTRAASMLSPAPTAAPRGR